MDRRQSNDAMPQILWTRYFLEAQGYGVKDLIIFQDNQSAVLLEKNGKASSSKRTCHINTRYFFVTDCIEAKEVSVQYCPTQEMVADFFTKPLQGVLFQKFRNKIMNVDPATVSFQDHRSAIVGNMDIQDTDGEWIKVQGKKERSHVHSEGYIGGKVGIYT